MIGQERGLCGDWSLYWANFCYWTAVAFQIIICFQVQFMCIYWRNVSTTGTIASAILGFIALTFWLAFYIRGFYEILVTFWTVVLLNSLAAVSNIGYFFGLSQTISMSQVSPAESADKSSNISAAISCANALGGLNFCFFLALLSVLVLSGFCVFY